MSIAVYPGSFDPITCGHLDIIRRSAALFDEVVVAVLKNSAKKPLFSAEERVRLIEKSVSDIPNCRVIHFDGLLVDCVKALNARVIIKGLRAISDFEYEFQMAQLNKKLNPEIETFFMVTNANYSYISSSIVKEIAHLGGDFSDLLPKEIYNDVKEKIKKGRL
ncbi:MAG: pantetheine-phosphate adenylyltransferase [Ruminococcaceae bacterium]|nr:pantetheine-phosphate adenylyltransferase [Oscillospiraceae bacterium]